MSRTKKSKIFDLFKSNFKISFFYKPIDGQNDDFYYIVLDDIIKLRLKLIENVVVIDMIIPITKSYITPIYDKLIKTIMGQDRLTVLLFTMTTSYEVHQVCMINNAPIVEDEQYITISNSMYQKWRGQDPSSINRFGFYILSVSSDESQYKKEYIEPKVVDVPIDKNSGTKLTLNPNSIMDKIKEIIMGLSGGNSSIDDIKIENITDNNIKCIITEYDTFEVELDNKSLYIKDLLVDPDTTLNLVQILAILNTFEKLINIIPNIYLLNVRHAEIYRMCIAKKYELLSEENKIPANKIFKQVFLGYGTYKVIVTN